MLNLNLTHLMDDAKCYESVRQMRWKTNVAAPSVMVQTSSSGARMTLKLSDNGITVRGAVLTLTT